ncbi:hypothetical protein PO909_018059, partial [Leuciscus waleckii]
KTLKCQETLKLLHVHRTRLSLCELQCTYKAWGNVFFSITCTPPLFPDMTDAPSNPNPTHSPRSNCNGSSTSKILTDIASAVMLSVSTNPTARSFNVPLCRYLTHTATSSLFDRSLHSTAKIA